MGRVIVIGSINQDVTVSVERFPQPGETLRARSVSHRLGGKGANQAAAAAHAGARTLMVGRVGSDDAGRALREELAEHGVDVTGLLVDDAARTGTAFITVSAEGENTILLDAGTNGRVTGDQAAEVVALAADDVVVLQGEVPARANEGAVAWARAAGARVVLNLAPVYDVDDAVLADVDVLVVNETEAGALLGRSAPHGVEEALGAAGDLRRRTAGAVLLTLGGAGAVWSSGDTAEHVAAVDLGPVVDTTGAGDACVGVLAAALAAGSTLADAVTFAMRAGATAVLTEGAAASYGGIEPVVAAVR